MFKLSVCFVSDDMFVVVNHMTIVAIGHGLRKKFWPKVICYVLRNAETSLIWTFADPLTLLVLPNH